jgi:hypothetical protein
MGRARARTKSRYVAVLLMSHLSLFKRYAGGRYEVSACFAPSPELLVVT